MLQITFVEVNNLRPLRSQSGQSETDLNNKVTLLARLISYTLVSLVLEKKVFYSPRLTLIARWLYYRGEHQAKFSCTLSSTLNLFLQFFRLANESAVKDIQQKLRDVQKENDEINSRLTKKERECDVKTEEKVCVIENIKISDFRLFQN